MLRKRHFLLLISIALLTWGVRAGAIRPAIDPGSTTTTATAPSTPRAKNR
jgi:hypothetical protein